MANFAVLDDNNFVENVIVAETLEIAESLTGKTCIEYKEGTLVSDLTYWDSKNKQWIVTEPRVVEEKPTDTV